jgi:hypothetical protein
MPSRYGPVLSPWQLQQRIDPDPKRGGPETGTQLNGIKLTKGKGSWDLR